MVDLKKDPEAKVVLDYTSSRIRKRLGCNIIFTGELGKGKSYGGMRLLELWYKKHFDEPFPQSHICQDLEQAIILIKDFERKGEGILIEELSVLAGTRNALTKQNKNWNTFLDIVRIKQVVMVGNCPYLSFIDQHIVKLCQIWIEALGINFKKEIVICKPLMLQPSQVKTYKHRFIDDEGDEIHLCYFRKPSKDLCEFYDKRKLRSHEEITEELILKMRQDRIKKLKQLGKKELPKREQEAYNYYLKGLTAKESAKKMGLKFVDTYNQYLRRAKAKMKAPK